MKERISRTIWVLLSCFVTLFIFKSECASTKLEFKEVFQEQWNWCWAASCKAILDHYGKTISQCKMANYAFGQTDCCDNVVWRHGTGAECDKGNADPNKILSHFGKIATSYINSSLSLEECQEQIENNKPIYVSWHSKNSNLAHAVVVYGVSGDTIYFLDPWPGDEEDGTPREGLKFASYNNFLENSKQKWEETILMNDPPKPGLVSAIPTNDPPWTSSPQTVDVRCNDADEIYYTLRYTTNGKDPKPPATPSSTSSDGSINGSSGQFEVKGIAGKKKILMVKFRGHNKSGDGPTTGPFTYTIDLTGSSLDPKIAQLPMSGPPGTEFVQWGTGFTSEKTVTLSFKKNDEASEPTSKKEYLDRIGHFEVRYKSPLDKPLGTYCWKAVDDQTKRESNEVCYQITGSTGSVSGVLHENSADGKALSGAKVTCGGQTGKTQSDGSFSLSNVVAGSQTLAFSLSGYIAYQRSVVVVAGQNTDAGHRWLVKEKEEPVTSKPNLAIHQLKIKKSSEDDSELGHTLRLAPGEKFDIKVWIKNRGNSKATMAFSIFYLRSDDSRIAEDDTQIGSDWIETDIGIGKTIAEWKQKISAPFALGTYYIGARVNSYQDSDKENDFSRGDKERGKIIVENPNQQPVGSLDCVACNAISGLARDPDTTEPIKVDIYADGPAGSGTFLGEVTADIYRSDFKYLPGVDKNHGFVFQIPSSLKDGKPHAIYAYAVDSAGGSNPLLDGSPKSTNCSEPSITHMLPDTGQSKCYDNATEISCPNPGELFYGQDAQYQGAQPSYFDHCDGTVTDLNTGLMWQKENLLNKSGRTHQELVSDCESLELGGYSDWRLPSRRELFSIFVFDRWGPAWNTDFFPNETVAYVGYDTSDASRNNKDCFWYVHRDVGESYWGCSSTSSVNSIKCVRGTVATGSVYVDNSDGTVSDLNTGLMWQQVDNGEKWTWSEALSYCEGLDLANYDDWRLPNIRELESIVDLKSYPAIDASYFPPKDVTNFCDMYWSSTTPVNGNYAHKALQVNFSDGWISSGGCGDSNTPPTEVDKDLRYFVRCVRGGTISQ